jgi:hypothetical protein
MIGQAGFIDANPPKHFIGVPVVWDELGRIRRCMHDTCLYILAHLCYSSDRHLVFVEHFVWRLYRLRIGAWMTDPSERIRETRHRDAFISTEFRAACRTNRLQ